MYTFLKGFLTIVIVCAALVSKKKHKASRQLDKWEERTKQKYVYKKEIERLGKEAFLLASIPAVISKEERAKKKQRVKEAARKDHPTSATKAKKKRREKKKQEKRKQKLGAFGSRERARLVAKTAAKNKKRSSLQMMGRAVKALSNVAKTAKLHSKS